MTQELYVALAFVCGAAVSGLVGLFSESLR